MFRKRIFAYLLILVSTIFFALNYIFEWFKMFVFVMSIHYILIAASILLFFICFLSIEKSFWQGGFAFA